MPLIKNRYCPLQSGASLLEVLISIVLISIVLLGVAAMAMTSMNENQSAYYRSQANAIAYDMADRIRLNPGSLSDYEFNTTDAGTIPGAVNCTTGVTGCSEAEQRAQDLREWTENFFDLNGIGVDGGAYQSLIPNSSGAIDVNGDVVEITVAWQESDWQVTAANNKATSAQSLVLEFQVTN